MNLLIEIILPSELTKCNASKIQEPNSFGLCTYIMAYECYAIFMIRIPRLRHRYEYCCLKKIWKQCKVYEFKKEWKDLQ